MNEEELRDELIRLSRNYADAIKASEKYVATEPLKPGVDIQAVPQHELLEVYENVDRTKADLVEFRKQHPTVI
jgi:hypothetical protein